MVAFNNFSQGAGIGSAVLGTAQLGFGYGIGNECGPLSDCGAESLIEAALKLGIRDFDTASVYGASEIRLGAVLHKHKNLGIRVATKIPPLRLVAGYR